MPRWFGSRSSSMAASASRSRTGGLYIGIILAVCGLVFLLVYEAIRATAQAALGVSHLEAAVIAVAAIAVVTCAMGLLAARALRRKTRREFSPMTGDASSTPPAAGPPDSGEIAPTPATHGAADPIMGRLESEIQWYSRKSGHCQRLYKWLKFTEISAAAAIPLVAAFSAPIEVGAVLGTLIVVLEGLQQINQYQSNWITFRSTCEALKHEKFLYLASAGPYDGAHPRQLLAERIESRISREHARWVSARKEPARTRGGGEAEA